MPRLAGGRSSATASPVTRSSVVSVANSGGRASRRGSLGGPSLGSGMDLDAYVAAHVAEWRRLEELTRRRRLSGAESDELVERYQQVATHLSVVRTSAPDADVVAYLSTLLARARNRASGTRTSTWRGVRGFFVEPLPGRALPAALVVAGHARRQRRRDRA